MLDPHSYAIGKLTDALGDLCCDEVISEEEMESILDDAQGESTEQICRIAEKYGITISIRDGF